MLVLSEDSPRLVDSPSSRSVKAVTEAAKLVGCRIHYIPQEEDGYSACEALSYLPVQDDATPAVWLGYIPSADWYAAIYEAALQKRICLLNTLEEHLNAQEFDSMYARLQDLTPASVIITESRQCAAAVDTLGLPVFVKGVIQSRKARGWKACVADTVEELQRLCDQLLSLDNRSRGRVAVRKLVPLRHSRSSAQGFPFGREFRVFLYREKALGSGYYWEGDDPLKDLSKQEERTVLDLSVEAARRVGTPFIAVDIGQTEEGDWIVIETGDAQFSGASQIPLLPLWHAISQIRCS